MRAYFSHGPDLESEWEMLLSDAEADPGLANAIRGLQDAGWEIAIASAGSTWYIDRILARAGVTGVAVHANPGSLHPGRGLWTELPVDSPFFSPNVGIDKPAVVRDALARAATVAFAGDGPPDVAAALLVRPDLRFARGWLAAELGRRGESYRGYERFSDVARALTALDES